MRGRLVNGAGLCAWLAPSGEFGRSMSTGMLAYVGLPKTENVWPVFMYLGMAAALAPLGIW